MNTQKIKNKLRQGEVTLGTWIQIAHGSTAEIMGAAGYDWIAVDLEHGSISLESLPNLFRAISLHGSVPFIRVSQNHPSQIKKALDAGAKGIIVPMIESAEDVRQLNEWSKYPPVGKRGVGFSRANLFGKKFDTYMNSINDELVLVAQLETLNAIENLEELLQAAPLDAVMVGPYDLSASMGITAQFDDPEFIRALYKILSVTRKQKIPMGIHIVEPYKNELRKKISDGYQFIAYGIDATFLYNACECPSL